jgi:hypothetical protein
MSGEGLMVKYSFIFLIKAFLATVISNDEYYMLKIK